MNSSRPLLLQQFSVGTATMRVAVVTETYPPEINGVAMSDRLQYHEDATGGSRA